MKIRSKSINQIWSLLIGCSLLLGAEAAFAQQPARPKSVTGDEKAAAEALYVEAQKLITQGRYAEACPKLEDSQRRDPGIGTMLYLADCYEKIGRYASAWAQFREAEDIAHKENDERAGVAMRHADALEPRLARLTIKIAPGADVPGLSVKRDNAELGVSERGVAIPVDPGDHVVIATAPKKKPLRRVFSIADVAANSDLIIPPLEDAPEPRAAPAATREVDEPTKGNTQRVLGLAVGGVGAAGIIVGSIVGFSAKSKYDESNPHCTNNYCDPTGSQQRHDAFDAATVSTAFWVAGGTLLAGGAVIYFTAPRSKIVTLGASPTPGGGTASLALTF